MPLARLRPHLALLVAAALLLVGVVLLATAPGSVATCGFFSYAPRQGAGPSRAVVLAGRQLSGAVVLGLGLLALALAVGQRTGRRTP